MTAKLTKTKPFILILILFIVGNLNAQQGEVTINQDDRINKLLEFKKDIEKTSERYKIQIFFGASRNSAEQARAKFLQNHSDIETRIEYETPNYKIRVGDFRSRLEADRALILIKKNFPNAIILRPRE